MRFRKYDGAADGDWENCVRSQGAYFAGDWGIIVLRTAFLVSSSINVSVFHSTWLDTSWTDLVQELEEGSILDEEQRGEIWLRISLLARSILQRVLPPSSPTPCSNSGIPPSEPHGGWSWLQGPADGRWVWGPRQWWHWEAQRSGHPLCPSFPCFLAFLRILSPSPSCRIYGPDLV